MQIVIVVLLKRSTGSAVYRVCLSLNTASIVRRVASSSASQCLLTELLGLYFCTDCSLLVNLRSVADLRRGRSGHAPPPTFPSDLCSNQWNCDI